ncbi:MAG: phosphatase PAP2 family protein [Chitinophagales bacterium]|nr:phosphatase PAP2 family protein [Chitinophagales bacterium]MDW8427842.1 phosphatase PAP2 family protein [Chitinophagales bacterium]
MNTLQQIDRQLFFFINHQLSNAFFDQLMPLVRDKYFWLPLYGAALVYLYFRLRRHLWVLLPFVALTLLLTDQMAASVIKPLVGRPRPCHDALLSSDVHLLVPCGPGFSFVSAHAANAFGVASFLSFAISRLPLGFILSALLWATSIGFAQIYVGVHYPSDVLAGAVLGLMLGAAMAKIFRILVYHKSWTC